MGALFRRVGKQRIDEGPVLPPDIKRAYHWFLGQRRQTIHSPERLIREVHFKTFSDGYSGLLKSLADYAKNRHHKGSVERGRLEQGSSRELVLSGIAKQFRAPIPATFLGVIDGDMRIRQFVDQSREFAEEERLPQQFWFLLLYFAVTDCDDCHRKTGYAAGNQMTRIFTYRPQSDGPNSRWKIPTDQICFHLLNLVAGVTTFIEIHVCGECGVTKQLRTTFPEPKSQLHSLFRPLADWYLNHDFTIPGKSGVCPPCVANPELPMYGLDYVVVPRFRRLHGSTARVYLDFGDTISHLPGYSGAGFVINDRSHADVFKADFEARLTGKVDRFVFRLSFGALLSEEPLSGRVHRQQINDALTYLQEFFLQAELAASAKEGTLSHEQLAILKQWEILSTHFHENLTDEVRMGHLKDLATEMRHRLRYFDAFMVQTNIMRAERKRHEGNGTLEGEEQSNLQLATDRAVLKLLEQDEHQELEFKASLEFATEDDPDFQKLVGEPARTEYRKKVLYRVLCAICSFVNADGGKLIIGAIDRKTDTPEGRVVGLKGDYALIQNRPNRDGFEGKLRDLIRSRIDEDLLPHICFAEINGEEVCCITVESGEAEPVFLDAEEHIYVRMGNQSIKKAGKAMLKWARKRKLEARLK